MIDMKKRIFALSLILSCLCAVFFFSKSPVCIGQVRAETGNRYACVLSDSAYFYASDAENTELFLLPKSYFVKILHEGAKFTKVEYQTDGEQTKKLVGYCKTDQLTPVDFVPYAPYLTATFSVRYTVDGAPSNDPFLTPVTVDCTYYGKYTVGAKTYCYVLRGDEFTYVPYPDDFTYPSNLEYEQRKPSQTPQPTDSTTTSQNGGQIAVIILVSVLILVLAALIVKQPKKHVYEQED